MILRFKPLPGRAGVLADWEVVFGEGFLEGLTLVGGSIMESLYTGGSPYVTLPKCGEYQLLRGADHRHDKGRVVAEFKAYVLAAWVRGEKSVTVHGVDMDSPLEE